jgi:hypothetical protein
MFEDVGAEDEVERAIGGGKAAVEIGGNEVDGGRVVNSRDVDAGDAEAPLGENLAEVSIAAADIEHAASVALRREFG